MLMQPCLVTREQLVFLMPIMTILLLNMVILRSSIGHAHNGLESLQKYRLESSPSTYDKGELKYKWGN